METFENNQTENGTGSNQKQTQYYKLRGWTVKFLEDLQNSGGKTTREISDATGCKARTAAVILQRLRLYGTIERIVGWGWKITSDGINFLLSKKKNNNNKYVNSWLTEHKQLVNTKAENEKPENPEWIPSCFYRASCHIRSIMKKSVYNSKTSNGCEFCVTRNTHEYCMNMAGKFLGVI